MIKNSKILLLVLIVALLGACVYYYSFQSKSPPVDSLSARQALLSQSNPPANLTPAEIKARQKLLSASNPPSNLTPEQIKARQAAMENI